MKRWISVLLVVALLCAMPGTAVAYEFDTEEALDIPGGGSRLSWKCPTPPRRNKTRRYEHD